MPSRRIVALVFTLALCVAILVVGWRRNGPNTFEAALQPGGSASLDLSAGAYEIRGTDENRVRVEIDPASLRSAHSEIQVNGTHASVRVEGPPNNVRAVIYVPQQTNLTVDQTIGDLRIVGVEGDKYVGLNIGQIQIELPQTDQLKKVDASVTIGALTASAWHTEKGGLLRSFEASGHGKYKVSARLNIGNLELR
jgi:hypothetical protein